MKTKNAVGRPPKYKNKEQIEEMIEQYFKSCEGEILKDRDGERLMKTKNAVGRPPKYKNKEQIEEMIEQYFKSCEGEILKDRDGEPVFNKYGQPVIVNQRPPTVTGLAL